MSAAPRVALATALCALAAPLHAQSIGSLNRTGTGARAAGMANAFVAVSDDGTAASWNPAGLAQLRKPEFSIVHGTFNRDFSREGFRSPDGAYTYSPSRSAFTGTVPEFASVAVPFALFGRPVTVQVDWRRQYQFGGHLVADLQRFPTQGAGAADLRVGVDEEGHGHIDLWSLAGAVRVGRHSSLGVSGSLWRGDWGFSSTFTESPLPATAPASFATVRQRQRMRGANATLGLLVDHSRLRVGAVARLGFRSPFWQESERISSRAPAQRFDFSDLRLRLATSVAAGAAFRPGRGWTLALDLTHDPWSRAAIQGAPGGELGFFDGLPFAETSTRDTVAVNLGAEKLFPRDGRVIPLRFGVAYEPQGPRDVVTLDPQDYVFLALGSGYNTNRIKFDVAVQYGWNAYQATAHLATLPPPSARAHNAIGRVASREWRLKASAIYRLTDTEKLLAKLRSLF